MSERHNETSRTNEPAWYADLRAKPEIGQGFSKELRFEIRHKAMQSDQRSKNRHRYRVGASVLLLVSLVASALWFWGANGGTMQPPGNGKALQGDQGSGWEPHREIWSGGKKVLEVFPGGDYTAGKYNGSWWNLYLPFEQVKDNRIRIEAIHKESGWKQPELEEAVFSAKGMEYKRQDGSKESFSRIGTSFSLPLAGIWRFDVFLDGKLLGDVVFEVPDAPWTLSPSFQSGAYTFRGLEGKIGFIDPSFKAGQPNKAIWHLWGKEAELKGGLTVFGIRQGQSKPVQLFGSSEIGGALNGADASVVSSLTMPEKGLWRLMAYIDGKLFGSVVVEVKE
ncbi:DUF4871 domain-containing protein [Paenibacillus sp. MBLB4367]|uniref:DUF4871 domain-containing protein n=1 Tax=Paenibacillus sp. MBLB4367 TaxID=3384767 RepID=UPI003907F586